MNAATVRRIVDLFDRLGNAVGPVDARDLLCVLGMLTSQTIRHLGDDYSDLELEHWITTLRRTVRGPLQ